MERTNNEVGWARWLWESQSSGVVEIPAATNKVGKLNEELTQKLPKTKRSPNFEVRANVVDCFNLIKKELEGEWKATFKTKKDIYKYIRSSTRVEIFASHIRDDYNFFYQMGQLIVLCFSRFISGKLHFVYN